MAVMTSFVKIVAIFHLFLFTIVTFVSGRIHKLRMENDNRPEVELTKFGFLKKGYLYVNLTRLMMNAKVEEPMFGFSLTKSSNSEFSPFMDRTDRSCIINDKTLLRNTSAIFFQFNMETQRLDLLKGGDLKNLTIYHATEMEFTGKLTRSTRSLLSDKSLINTRRTRREVAVKSTTTTSTTTANNSVKATAKGVTEHSSAILRPVTNAIPFTLYQVFGRNAVSLYLHLTENNDGNYLSAGHMPLPALYSTMCIVYFMLGWIWLYVLRNSSEGVYRIHCLMLTLLFVKSIALLFHAGNYMFIRWEGHHEEAFAILYYITHLMKGALLFITIVLIGAGWAFVKHMLSTRDKKIFLFVIPLQILANVAQIIMEETDEGQTRYATWKTIFILVDLLCCGAILFPVVWSIRHLHEGSQTDGKAAINLQKLKIFRHFYLMIVIYIYFTRIIVYLMKITVPFQYDWIDEFFKEIATTIFFVVTGYKFRPASDNPYLQVPTDSDDELEMSEVISETGMTDTLTKVNQHLKDNEGPRLKQREASHEFD